MYIIYYFYPSVSGERGDEADICIDTAPWEYMALSECVWMVPGTVDPSED